jgi:membrane protease YdiL (CAAX protease family)
MTRLRALGRLSDEAAPALFPILILALAAFLREVRLVVLVILVIGLLITVHRGATVRWVYAGAVPVAVFMTWRLITAPLAHAGGLDCADAASPPAIWRFLQATLALTVLTAVMVVLRVRPSAIWVRRPSVAIARLSVLGFFVAGPLGLVLGAMLARPYFGTFDLDLTQPAALIPGMIFSLSNAIGEEVLYRGALMAFLARVIGLHPALVVQAVIFGLAHAGAHFMGSAIPVVLGVGAAGVVAGMLVIKTRSLMLPTAVHVAVDLPIYAFFACRAPIM